MQTTQSNSGEAQTFDVVIIGAGFSGLLCVHYLMEAGFHNIALIEKNPSVGGVWSSDGVGSYPGAACDVQAYSYLPFLDRTGFIPSKKYVSQPEISAYAELLTDHIGARDKILFSRKVVELRYLEDRGVWQVSTVDASSDVPAEMVTCNHIINANGPLSTPRMPEMGGMELFRGESFHTAQWDKNAQLAGKRVGVIGTGASAAQVITSIVDDVATLTVFQRTPTWCLRRDDEPTSPEIAEKLREERYGEQLRFVDWRTGISAQDVPIDFEQLQDPEQNDAICAELAAEIREDVDDPELAKRLTPDYPFFCKRALFIDDYYTTFNKPHVTLVDDENGVVSVDETGVTIARGEHFELDVIIYATGFDSLLIPFPIIGRGGVKLADKFGANEANHYQMTRPHSLWGIHVDDMPNFYMMVGPQSLNPVTNVTILAEEQAKHIANLLKEMREAGQTLVEPRKEAVDKWADLCAATAEGKVWLRCNNWYAKTTKTDVQAGRERSTGIWMETYPEYLQYLLGGKGGTTEELLEFS